jgi:hypothetical protein
VLLHAVDMCLRVTYPRTISMLATCDKGQHQTRPGAPASNQSNIVSTDAEWLSVTLLKPEVHGFE